MLRWIYLLWVEGAQVWVNSALSPSQVIESCGFISWATADIRAMRTVLSNMSIEPIFWSSFVSLAEIHRAKKSMSWNSLLYRSKYGSKTEGWSGKRTTNYPIPKAVWITEETEEWWLPAICSIMPSLRRFLRRETIPILCTLPCMRSITPTTRQNKELCRNMRGVVTNKYGESPKKVTTAVTSWIRRIIRQVTFWTISDIILATAATKDSWMDLREYFTTGRSTWTITTRKNQLVAPWE